MMAVNRNMIFQGPRFTFDVCPQDDETIKLEPWGNIPLDDNSVDSICVDLPVCCSTQIQHQQKKKTKKKEVI